MNHAPNQDILSVHNKILDLCEKEKTEAEEKIEVITDCLSQL